MELSVPRFLDHIQESVEQSYMNVAQRLALPDGGVTDEAVTREEGITLDNKDTCRRTLAHLI